MRANNFTRQNQASTEILLSAKGYKVQSKCLRQNQKTLGNIEKSLLNEKQIIKKMKNFEK